MALLADFAALDPASPRYLERVAEQVQRHKCETVALAAPAGHRLRVGGLDETAYAGDEAELEAWQAFYTPEETRMTVLGTVDVFASLAAGLQLVVLAGADGRVYAYENEVLHEVAPSVAAALTRGLQFPGARRYEYGAIFAPMTEAEREELERDEEVMRDRRETAAFIKGNEAEFLAILARIEAKK
ncbi:putative US22-like protein [Namao virus]|nr:putative US22-like protein [Namao virus]